MTKREIADVLLDRVVAALDGLGHGGPSAMNPSAATDQAALDGRKRPAQTGAMHEGRGE
jgi:hypothetical protein